MRQDSFSKKICALTHPQLGIWASDTARGRTQDVKLAARTFKYITLACAVFLSHFFCFSPPNLFFCMRATRFLPISLALLNAISGVSADSDVTVTVTSNYVAQETVTAFVYTNSLGSLTTQLFTRLPSATASPFVAPSETSQESSAASSAPASSSAPVSSAPVSSAPVSSAPVSSAPASSAAASSAAASSGVASSAAGSSASASSVAVSSAGQSSAPSSSIKSSAAASSTISSVAESSSSASSAVPSSSSAAESSSLPSETLFVLPPGTYYTKTEQSTTTMEDGASAVIEYVIMYTNACGV